MRVRAKVPMYYSRRMYAVGDEYEMDDREHGEAKILSVLGKIEVMTDAVRQQAVLPTDDLHLHTAAMKAEPEPMTTEGDALTSKRVYRRRDMRAEK